MRNLILLITGFIFGCVITYTSLPRKRSVIVIKPPNTVHHNIKDTSYTVTHVAVTCYRPIKAECDNDPLTTSDGSRINLNHLKCGKIKWCAISQDLLYLFPKGKQKKVWIDGFGLYEVMDVMNKRHKHKVDLLIHPKNAMRIKIDNVKIKIPR